MTGEVDAKIVCKFAFVKSNKVMKHWKMKHWIKTQNRQISKIFLVTINIDF